jgi:hypothetical protein
VKNTLAFFRFEVPTVINVNEERLLTLAEAARSLPGGPVHVSTIHRWRLRGVRGVKLEVLLRGGIRYTSSEALGRFYSAVTAAADAAATPNSAQYREKTILAAANFLAEEGM